MVQFPTSPGAGGRIQYRSVCMGDKDKDRDWGWKPFPLCMMHRRRQHGCACNVCQDVIVTRKRKVPRLTPEEEKKRGSKLEEDVSLTFVSKRIT